MPRKTDQHWGGRFYTHATRETIAHLANPLAAFSRCESPAFVRHAIDHALKKDLAPIAKSKDLLPTSQMISLSDGIRHSNDTIRAIEIGDDINNTASIAATNLRNARVFFQQATRVTEEVRPILYYYGALSFLEFITRVIVRREKVGNPGHGVSVSCGSDGRDFNKDWARNKCRIEFGTSGDFPFIVDTLTLAGWPSLFSTFRLHKETKITPWELKENPDSLFKMKKMSLDLLCNFDHHKYLADHPDLNSWLRGEEPRMVWKTTALLMDFLVVFIASNLARYYIPAWHAIIEAEKSSIYNDIREAYSSVSEKLPYHFESEYPFQYSFETRLG